MTNRREQILDAAIDLLGSGGAHAVTHRAVDPAAGLPAGSTSNYFRSRNALLEAVVERFATRERANADDIAASLRPTTPSGLAEALAAFALDRPVHTGR
jgi:DNA-binding transcriptional regulator YbjK